MHGSTLMIPLHPDRHCVLLATDSTYWSSYMLATALTTHRQHKPATLVQALHGDKRAAAVTKSQVSWLFPCWC
jgi:hypothetical protein